MKKCVIIVPIYKYNLYDFEILSLKRIIDLYSNKDFCDIFFLCPEENINLDKIFIDNNIDIEYYHYCCFPNFYFQSVHSYNELMCMRNFYKMFLDMNYEYMLIYQLDAYIFDDQLEYWMNKDYDFLGGFMVNPFIQIDDYIQSYLYPHLDKLFNTDEFTKNNNEYKLLMNGGLSLRKIKTIYDFLVQTDLLLYVKHTVDNQFYLAEDCIYSLLFGQNVLPSDSFKFAFSGMANLSFQYMLNDWKYPFGIHYIDRGLEVRNFINKYNKEHNIDYGIQPT